MKKSSPKNLASFFAKKRNEKDAYNHCTYNLRWYKLLELEPNQYNPIWEIKTDILHIFGDLHRQKKQKLRLKIEKLIYNGVVGNTNSFLSYKLKFVKKLLGLTNNDKISFNSIVKSKLNKFQTKSLNDILKQKRAKAIDRNLDKEIRKGIAKLQGMDKVEVLEFVEFLRNK